MGQGAPTTTSYALLGLLSFDRDTVAAGEPGLTGYELKQRAYNTLRFYWVSPATSQIYTELGRLQRLGLVAADVRAGRRTTRRYRITPDGTSALRGWLTTAEIEFPVLKHPVALRLLLGHLTGPDEVSRMLSDYVGQLDQRRAELRAVRASLGDDPRMGYPAMVADWGLDYYRDELRTVGRLLRRLESAPE